MSRLSNKIGPPVEGSDFYGRKDEITDGWDALSNGNHLLIVAPRRVGKSSYSKRMITEVKSKGWKGIYIDVQEVTSEIGFMEVLANALSGISGSWFGHSSKSTINALNAVLSKIKFDWETDAGKISLGFGELNQPGLKNALDEALIKAGELLIVVDELPYFLTRLEKEEGGEQRISAFLHLLRALRQRTGNQIRWIFCGSIGLDTFAARHKLSETLNDLLPVDLAAFDPETARLFLKKLGKDNELGLSEENIDDILELIGWPLPFFLQAHFGQLRRLAKHENIEVDKALIKQAYQQVLQKVTALKTWDERLEAQIPEHAVLCRKLLIIICQHKNGITRKQIFDRVFQAGDEPDKLSDQISRCFAVLKHDGYLLSDGDIYVFRSPLVRDYWFDLYVK